MMSERMKQEGRLQGVTPGALWQHQNRGREALRLEMAGDYAAAARAWQHAANRAPHPQWRLFSRERARRCRETLLFRQRRY
ncbi:TPA: hypothetical protein ACJCK2_002911 [Salmonella enterica subsp. enterica]|uniref:hypothetical protein n=1 Tax=Salmonella enterica TaxID=28901 RepID=UPI0038453BB0